MVQDSFIEQSYSSNKQAENEIPGLTFEVKQLENTYIEIIKSYGYFIESDVSRFGDC